MSIDKPMAIHSDHSDFGRASVTASRRHSGQRRLLIAAVVLAVVVTILAIAGPAVWHPPHQRDVILPGLTLEDATNPKSLIVTSVQSDSIADNAGVEAGDRIIALDRQAVASRAEARAYLDHHHPPAIELLLARGDKLLELAYTFPKGSSQ